MPTKTKKKSLDPTRAKTERIDRRRYFSPKQMLGLDEDWANPTIQEICYDGGARSGKTYLIIKAIISRAFLSVGSRHLIARYRLNHLRISVWRQTLLPCLRDMGFVRGRDYDLNETELIITFRNGSEIYGAGLDDSDRVEKIMGTEFNTIFLNEASQISYNTYQKVKSRLSYVRDDLRNKIIVDCNPRNRFHWIYKYFVLNQDPDTSEALARDRVGRMARRHWTPLDNPFTTDEYKQILSELTGAERERLFLGQWIDVQGLVYPMFESVIVEPFEIPADWDCAGAVDFGYTNPFVFLWFFFDKANETWYLADEHYLAGKTVRKHCFALRKKRKPNLWIVSDHDSGDRATMAECGWPTIGADKEISPGIQAVVRLMEATDGLKIRIFRSCVHTIEELSTYSYHVQKDGKNAKEEPIKDKDHAMDAFRYWALRVIGKKNVVQTISADKIRERQDKELTRLSDIRAGRLRRFGLDSDLPR